MSGSLSATMKEASARLASSCASAISFAGEVEICAASEEVERNGIVGTRRLVGDGKPTKPHLRHHLRVMDLRHPLPPSPKPHAMVFSGNDSKEGSRQRQENEGGVAKPCGDRWPHGSSARRCGGKGGGDGEDGSKRCREIEGVLASHASSCDIEEAPLGLRMQRWRP